jgi:hypothetical protein
VGHLEIPGGEADDTAGKNPEAFDAGRFLAGLEEKLVAETDAQIRSSCKSPITHGIPESG